MQDFSRTNEAIEAYDAECAKPTPEDFGEAWKKLRREEELAVRVGEAYGLDTADINDLATCRAAVHPGEPKSPGHPDESFVRRMVRLWREGKL